MKSNAALSFGNGSKMIPSMIARESDHKILVTTDKRWRNPAVLNRGHYHKTKSRLHNTFSLKFCKSRRLSGVLDKLPNGYLFANI